MCYFYSNYLTHIYRRLFLYYASCAQRLQMYVRRTIMIYVQCVYNMRRKILRTDARVATMYTDKIITSRKIQTRKCPEKPLNNELEDKSNHHLNPNK